MSGAEVIDDLHIIAGLQRRDAAAMAELYDRYGVTVYSLAFRILGEAGQAEDAVQETFLRVWTRAHLIDPSRHSLAPWLLTIARNLSIDCLRAARSGGRLGHDLSDSLPSQLPFEALHSIDVSRALHKLSPGQRQVIELAYFEGLSQIEISARIGKPVGTVKTWVRTALGILRQAIEYQSLGNCNPGSSDARASTEAPAADNCTDARP